MDIEAGLKQAGLTGNETKIYQELIKIGPISVNDLAKRIRIDRTLAYTILNNLTVKGLVSYVIIDHKKYFRTTSVENLINSVKEKEAFVNKTISELKKIKKSEKIEQEINIYEGVNGAKVLVNEMMKEKLTLSFGGTGKLYDLMGFQAKHLMKKRTKKKMQGRVIISQAYKNHQITKIKNLEVRYLETLENPATTTIFGDKVSIHLLIDKPIIILIKNKEIAKTYREYFELLWKIAKP